MKIETNHHPSLNGKLIVESDSEANLLRYRWHKCCEHYLPIQSEDSIWCVNRHRKSQELSQGWKLHISATVLEACDLFEQVAPFLMSEDIQFKAPKSLKELSKLNSGLQYGYHQVGKFITVYPSSEKQAVKLAQKLDKLTEDFFPISVPFDEQYSPESSVFYRYGGFSNIRISHNNGETSSAITNPAGEFIPDNRRQAVPDWISDPFPNSCKPSEKTFSDTPLETTYRIFQAVTQRGKGGTYHAVDLSQKEPRLSFVKEGRKNGEIGWNGQDGYYLVKNEFEVLSILKEKYEAVPTVFDSFEIHGNFYFAMEHIDGKSLKQIMQSRRRRFSIKQVLRFAIEIARIIEEIHLAGWIWNDCKPGNLIVTKGKSLRPIDFESSYRINQPKYFDWKTTGFSRTEKVSKHFGKSEDIFALGAVIFFLLTGQLFDSENPEAIGKLRQNVHPKLIKITERLLFRSDLEISQTRNEFEEIIRTI